MTSSRYFFSGYLLGDISSYKRSVTITHPLKPDKIDAVDFQPGEGKDTGQLRHICAQLGCISWLVDWWKRPCGKDDPSAHMHAIGQPIHWIYLE